jgi:hypothetical protein
MPISNAIKALAQVLYVAWAASMYGGSEHTPEWSALGEPTREAWYAAAAAVPTDGQAVKPNRQRTPKGTRPAESAGIVQADDTAPAETVPAG